MNRKLRMGMIGGGRNAFIGAVHRIAANMDGLIELVSGRNDSPPPSLNPPIPADGPSQMSRHAVSGDGRYVVFAAYTGRAVDRAVLFDL